MLVHQRVCGSICLILFGGFCGYRFPSTVHRYWSQDHRNQKNGRVRRPHQNPSLFWCVADWFWFILSQKQFGEQHPTLPIWSMVLLYMVCHGSHQYISNFFPSPTARKVMVDPHFWTPAQVGWRSASRQEKWCHGLRQIRAKKGWKIHGNIIDISNMGFV